MVFGKARELYGSYKIFLHDVVTSMFVFSLPYYHQTNEITKSKYCLREISRIQKDVIVQIKPQKNNIVSNHFFFPFFFILFLFSTFFLQQYGSPPSKEDMAEAGNSCPICQEDFTDPIMLKACKVREKVL